MREDVAHRCINFRVIGKGARLERRPQGEKKKEREKTRATGFIWHKVT